MYYGGIIAFFQLQATSNALSIESTSKCNLSAKLGIMFEKDLVRCEEI